jgi:enamine deaminase RidA (YjgF/YER057c/UK114 family)
MLRTRRFAIASLLAALPARALAQERIHTPGGEVALPSSHDRDNYDRYHYAQTRRAGDFVYISGVVAGPAPGEGADAEAFKAQVRRAFTRITADLAAFRLTFANVVMINSFHVWSGPNFTGTRDEQFEAFSAVKDEFMPPPYPAWTAIGTTGLLAERGVVEIQMIASRTH